jgi:hypothetical protein
MGQIQVEPEIGKTAIISAPTRAEISPRHASPGKCRGFPKGITLDDVSGGDLTDDGILAEESLRECEMAIDEGRFEYLERALDDRRQDFTELKEAVRHLEIKMDERFANVDVRFLGMDSRFLAIENRLTALDSKLESKFDALDSKFDALDSKFEARFDASESKSESKFAGVQSQFDSVLKKMDSQFKWLVGIQFGVLVTVISVLLSR